MLTDDFCNIPHSVHTNAMTPLKTDAYMGHIGDVASHCVMCHTQSCDTLNNFRQIIQLLVNVPHLYIVGLYSNYT
jgi:hypothetical protein